MDVDLGVDAGHLCDASRHHKAKNRIVLICAIYGVMYVYNLLFL